MYSSYKAVFHQDRLDQLRRGELPLPTQVQLDLTGRCNHHCQYCYYEHLDKDFNTDMAINLINELAENGKPAVQFTGGGEPLMHPDFSKVAHRVLAAGMHFALVTNGALLKEEHMQLLKHADWVRVSLDAADAETYSYTQGCGKDEFHRVVHNIADLLECCGDAAVGVSFMTNPTNYREIAQAARLARGLAVKNFRVALAFTGHGATLFSGIEADVLRLAKEAEAYETKDFKVVNLVPHSLDLLHKSQKGYSFCGYQHFTSVIGADMELYPCCTLKYSGHGLGNLAKMSFREAWLGDRRAAWLGSEYLRDVCNSNPCGMDKKNSFIDYLVMKDPMHVEYI
jgi:MoaA/NifB/PqqE/SkfB family radical SAM enzyme